jgi:hypothetical protein
MVQTASTSQADQPHVRGATAVRAIGVLLILQGGWKLYTAVNAMVQLVERAIDATYVVYFLIVSGALGLATVIAGVLLVRRDRVGRVFGLVVCSIALVYQVLTVGSTFSSMYFLGRSPLLLGTLFWVVGVGSIVLFLAGVIVIARWRPYQLPDYYTPPR